MLGTEFMYGQGIGNQLFCYVSVRCAALDSGYGFGTLGKEYFGDRRINGKGLYFMSLDVGGDCARNDFKHVYREKSIRLFLSTCDHDRTIGCDISLFDPGLSKLEDDTLIYGNLQSERYFIHRKEEIKEWLRMDPQYDTYEYCADDLCILNMRGGEYVGKRELYLGRRYWRNAIQNMKRINKDMRFMIVTDDVKSAGKILPGTPAYHFELALDYSIIKNARYLVLSNSSFAFFPVFTSETIRYAIAPKYWARHNVSNGYWSTGQNIYSGWTYQDRDGRLWTGAECEKEFKAYQESSRIYEMPTRPLKRRIGDRILERIDSAKAAFLRGFHV